MHTVHNARISMLAGACANIGVGATLAGILAPIIKGEVDALRSFGVWLAIGVDFLWLAYILLGRLRDDA